VRRVFPFGKIEPALRDFHAFRRATATSMYGLATGIKAEPKKLRAVNCAKLRFIFQINGRSAPQEQGKRQKIPGILKCFFPFFCQSFFAKDLGLTRQNCTLCNPISPYCS
jgi:hypothetical protein